VLVTAVGYLWPIPLLAYLVWVVWCFRSRRKHRREHLPGLTGGDECPTCLRERRHIAQWHRHNPGRATAEDDVLGTHHAGCYCVECLIARLAPQDQDWLRQQSWNSPEDR
jgi:hypothetical protein